MRYYNEGDNIYIFGFSRGAYTARFLAEMIHQIGLLSRGNEEMIYFAWETFSNFQRTRGNMSKTEKRQIFEKYIRSLRKHFADPGSKSTSLDYSTVSTALDNSRSHFSERHTSTWLAQQRNT
jgi:uncharacterized protein (DUF2235 family)